MILSDLQLDFIKEIINIGIGKGADVLNKLVHEKIELRTLDLKIQKVDQSNNIVIGEKDTSSVVMTFSGPISGRTSLLFPSESALKLVHLIAPGLTKMNDFSHLKMNVLMEVGNIVINGIIGSIANVLQLHLSYSLPTYEQGCVNTWHSSEDTQYIIIISTEFKVQNNKIYCNIIICLEVKSLAKLINFINKALTR